VQFVKNLLFCFILFVAILYGLERTDLLVIATGVGAVMAAIVFIHILTTPDSKGQAQNRPPRT
jgi:hypothetical protein